MKIRIKALIKKIFLKCGYRIQRTIDDEKLHLWDEDRRFEKMFSEIADRTLVNKIRAFMIYQYAKQVFSLPGEVAEVGVYKGGTAKLLAGTFKSTKKTVYLFDTFAGMPASDPTKDTYKKGDFGDTSLEKVRAFLAGCKNIRIHQGVFPLKPNPIENLTFSLVHVDVDIYKSVMDCCVFFYSRMDKSGVMIFDDYGFPLCRGARAAVDEFFSDNKPENPCYLPTGQCVVVKL